jgi:hypothetical protein
LFRLENSKARPQYVLDAGYPESWDAVGHDVVYVRSTEAGRFRFFDGGVEVEQHMMQLPGPAIGSEETLFQWVVASDGGPAVVVTNRSTENCVSLQPFPVCGLRDCAHAFYAGNLVDGDLLDLTTNRMFLSARPPPWADDRSSEVIIVLPSGLRATCPANTRLGRVVATTSEGLWLVEAHDDDLRLTLLPLDGATNGGDVDGVLWATSAVKTVVWAVR